jgi:hypothetical protein
LRLAGDVTRMPNAIRSLTDGSAGTDGHDGGGLTVGNVPRSAGDRR